MAGLPKRYAKMGFKRGWRAFRASQSRGSTPQVKTMARRRIKSRRSFKSYAKRAGVGNSAALIQVDAMAYGAVREKVSNLIAPVTSKIPLGTLSDELGMALVNYMVAKKTSGMLRNVAMKGLVIENARVGEALATGGFSVISGTSGTGSSVYQYG